MNEHSPPPKTDLLRLIGPWTAVAVVVGATIGSGIFKKPQAVAQNIVSFEWIMAAWIVGGLLSLLGALALAEVAALLPRAGGNYVYLKEAYGPLWGFLWGWIEFWIMKTGAIAALAVMFAETLAALLGWAPDSAAVLKPGLAIAAIVILSGINAAGVYWGGLVQSLTTWLKVASLLAIGVLPFVLGQARLDYLTAVGTRVVENPWVGFGVAVLSILWAYHGWMDLAPLAEEVREPQRNLPRALILGVLIIVAVYLAANVAYAVVLPRDEMADPKRVSVVAVTFAQRVFLPWGEAATHTARAAISAAIMVSVLGALSANVLIGPRTYFALGREGLFPAWVGTVHPQYRTPVVAIGLQAVWSCVLVAAAPWVLQELGSREDPFDTLTNFVMYAAVILETIAVAAIFRLRFTRPADPRPFKCPGYPWVPLIFVLGMLGVAANTIYAQPVKSAWGTGFLLLGAVVYWCSRRLA
jgi:amino acid transporter